MGQFFALKFMWKGPALCALYHPLANGPELYMKVGWASQGKQASKQYLSMASVSVSSSWFLPWVPDLTSVSN